MGLEHTELSRRELLQILTPGSWLPDLLRDRELSKASKSSLLVDLATFTGIIIALVYRILPQDQSPLGQQLHLL